MAHFDQSARPVMGATARFHANQTGRAIRKMRQKTGSLDRLADDLARFRFDPMQLENALCTIHTDCGKLPFGPVYLSLRGVELTSHEGAGACLDPEGGCPCPGDDVLPFAFYARADTER